MAQIDIYTRGACGYCDRAKAVFERKGVAFNELNASTDHALREEMYQRSGRSTFPQIFIDGLHVGGSDDLLSLDSRGGLDPLLGT